eukprot:10057448-Alexandrium_andersonii.AAC.1
MNPRHRMPSRCREAATSKWRQAEAGSSHRLDRELRNSEVAWIASSGIPKVLEQALVLELWIALKSWTAAYCLHTLPSSSKARSRTPA